MLIRRKKRRLFNRLCAVLDEEDGGRVTWDAWQGTVEQHLDALIQRAQPCAVGQFDRDSVVVLLDACHLVAAGILVSVDAMPRHMK